MIDRVDGMLNLDAFILRKSDSAVIQRMTISAPRGTHEVDVPNFVRHEVSVNDEQFLEAAKLALT